jgi:hypothetical protein
MRPVPETQVTVTTATCTAEAGYGPIGLNRAVAVTVTLPPARVHPGRCHTSKDESGKDESGNDESGNIAASAEGSETIDGLATHTIDKNYGAKAGYSYGSNWSIVPPQAASAHTPVSHTGALQHEKGGLDAEVPSGNGFQLNWTETGSTDNDVDVTALCLR